MQKLLKNNYIKAVLCLALTLAAAMLSYPQAQTVFLAASATARKLPIYCVDRTDKKIAITFDAAWGADDTDELLRILEDNGVKATFFFCGYWVEKYPEEVKRFYEAGHDIGNHSDTHAHVAQLNREQNKREIQGAHDKVKALLGIEMNLYRPPYGEYNNTVVEAAESLGYYVIQWDVDSLDWKEYGISAQISKVLDHKHLGGGSILLFHNDAKYTPAALDETIKGLKAKGYEFVPVSELIFTDGYTIDHEGRQKLK